MIKNIFRFVSFFGFKMKGKDIYLMVKQISCHIF